MSDTFKPTDLSRVANELVASGQMTELSELLAALDEVTPPYETELQEIERTSKIHVAKPR
jgi:hypothetical protein